MKKLADEIIWAVVDEYGCLEVLRRMSNPFWFQAFGCVLGFDWHSSGLTTVVTGVLKNTLTYEKHGIMVAGGKGVASRKSLQEIQELGTEYNYSAKKIKEFQYASRMTAKVDNAAIQAGYPLYHHAFFLSEKGDWAVVQQGMNLHDTTARRYHWLSDDLQSFVVNPQKAIIGLRKKSRVLNMTAEEIEENRKVCVDLVKSNPNNLISSIRRIKIPHSLDDWLDSNQPIQGIEGFSMPRNLNWSIFNDLYDFQPKNYEEFLSFKGVGPGIVRALALISELTYGKPASWKDPIKFSYAFGGKDGVPRPIDKGEMDQAISFLHNALEKADFNSNEKKKAFMRLQNIVR
jgi:hypothetical protein